MAFNLNSLALKDTTELHLRHPATDELLYDEEKKPVKIVLYGTASKQYRNAITAMQNRSLKRGKKQVSAELMREEGIDLLVECSEIVYNMEYNGKKVDNNDAFKAMYSDPEFSWVKDQVDAAITDADNFLGK